MKKIYWFAIILIITSRVVLAQSIVVSYPENVCLKSTQKIPVTVTGSFNADNKFSVQVRKAEGTPVLAEIPGVLKDNKIEVVYQDSTLSLYEGIQIKVVTSSPKSESNWTFTRIYSKGTVKLSLADSDTINANDALRIKFTTYSTSSVSITLNDSSKFSFFPTSYEVFDQFQEILTDSDKPFTITHAENSCGSMSISGSAKAAINPVSLRIVSITPASACEDNEIKVTFSTLESPLPAGTKFKLRFRETSYPNYQYTDVAEIAAELKNNVLIARIPKSLNLTTHKFYKIQIVTQNIVSPNSDIDLNLYPKPTVKFYTPSTSINVGETASLGLTLTGLPPFLITLQDGTNISSATSNSIWKSVTPETTTSYTIKSFSSGCGIMPVSNPETMVINVNSGLQMEQRGEEVPLCVGVPVRVKVIANLVSTASTAYTVHAVLPNLKEYAFQAKKIGSELEFTIPTLPATTAASLTYDNVNVLYVTSSNPADTSYYSGKYIIQTMPNAVIAEGTVRNYLVPDNSDISLKLTGKGPFNIEDAEGNVFFTKDSYWRPNFYVSKTMDYKPNSISNSCFKNDNITPIHLTLSSTRPKGIYMDGLKSPACLSDSVEITFSADGAFNAGNVFYIQSNGYGGAFQTLATVTSGGKYKVRALDEGGYAYSNFRIASTNPVLFSQERIVLFEKTPTAFSIYPNNTNDSPNTYLPGEEIKLSLATNGGQPTSFVYSDGSTDKTAMVYGYDFSVKLSPPDGITTAYTVKSTTNTCGTVPVNLTAYVKRIPYNIRLSDISGNETFFCQGKPFIVNFGLEYGESAEGTFSLEIAKEGSSDYTTIVKDEKGRAFSSVMPSDLAPGNYKIRIVSSEGGMSYPKEIRIGEIPTVTIKSDKPQPIQLVPGESLQLDLGFTGSAPYTVVFENGTRQTSNYTPDTRNIVASAAEQFAVKTVYNACGFGKASGSVSVMVKPQLYTYSSDYNVCEGGHVAVQYKLQGDANIASDYIRFELVDQNSKKVTPLDSVRTISGTITLRIPNSLPGTSYQIRSSLKSYNLTSILGVSVKTKIDVTLSGNTTINSGENAQLVIRSNKFSNEQITYILSEGTTGTFYSGSSNLPGYIKVNPAKTTTYTITSASNTCGDGKIFGSATVEVNPASSRTVTMTSLVTKSGFGICTSDTITVGFAQKGTFSAANVMTVQISDTTGKNFKSITTIGNGSPIKAIVPADLFASKSYRIRVVASDTDSGSGAYEYPLIPSQKATARFASESVLYDGITNPVIVVLLEGGSPWEYQFGTDIATQTRNSSTPTDSIYLQQASPNQYYKLFRVYNQCGLGTIGNPNTIRVEVITGEPAPIQSKIIVAPNPASDFLLLKFETALPRNITLFDIRGTVMQTKPIESQLENIDIRNTSSGVYILQIEEKGRKSTFKVIKQ